MLLPVTAEQYLNLTPDQLSGISCITVSNQPYITGKIHLPKVPTHFAQGVTFEDADLREFNHSWEHQAAFNRCLSLEGIVTTAHHPQAVLGRQELDIRACPRLATIAPLGPLKRLAVFTQDLHRFALLNEPPHQCSVYLPGVKDVPFPELAEMVEACGPSLDIDETLELYLYIKLKETSQTQLLENYQQLIRHAEKLPPKIKWKGWSWDIIAEIEQRLKALAIAQIEHSRSYRQGRIT